MSEEQQKAEVRKLLKTRDFYELLGVEKTASLQEIKSAYKKQALKFHPDKNKQPGAIDVFKKIAEAYDCLSNEDKRSYYDRYGSGDPTIRQQRYQEQFHTDIDPEVIFNMFFGDQRLFPGARFQFHTSNAFRQGPELKGNHKHQIVFLALFILLGIISRMYDREKDVYSFTQNSTYSTCLQHPKGFQYCVSPFTAYYINHSPYEKRTLEADIWQKKISTLIDTCNSESSNKAKILERLANMPPDHSDYMKMHIEAERISLKSCRELKNLGVRIQ